MDKQSKTSTNWFPLKAVADVGSKAIYVITYMLCNYILYYIIYICRLLGFGHGPWSSMASICQGRIRRREISNRSPLAHSAYGLQLSAKPAGCPVCHQQPSCLRIRCVRIVSCEVYLSTSLLFFIDYYTLSASERFATWTLVFACSSGWSSRECSVITTTWGFRSWRRTWRLTDNTWPWSRHL